MGSLTCTTSIPSGPRFIHMYSSMQPAIRLPTHNVPTISSRRCESTAPDFMGSTWQLEPGLDPNLVYLELAPGLISHESSKYNDLRGKPICFRLYQKTGVIEVVETSSISSRGSESLLPGNVQGRTKTSRKNDEAFRISFIHTLRDF